MFGSLKRFAGTAGAPARNAPQARMFLNCSAKVFLGVAEVLPDFLLNKVYTTVPNKAPMPAVIAIASAPQNVTRTIPIRMRAPPV